MHLSLWDWRIMELLFPILAWKWCILGLWCPWATGSLSYDKAPYCETPGRIFRESVNAWSLAIGCRRTMSWLTGKKWEKCVEMFQTSPYISTDTLCQRWIVSMEHMEHGKRRDARLKLHTHTHSSFTKAYAHEKSRSIAMHDSAVHSFNVLFDWWTSRYKMI